MSVILVDLPDGLRDDTSERLRQIIAAINGYNGQGIHWNLTAYSSDSKYGQQLRNLGTDGLHWAVYHSGSTIPTDAPIVEVQDAGLFVTDTDFRVYDGTDVVLNADATGVTVGSGYPTTLGGGLSVTGNLGVTGDITATGDISAGGTLAADDGLDVIAGPGGFGAIISGTVTLNGPTDIASTLDVTGASSFADIVSIIANSNSSAPLLIKNEGSGPLLSVLRSTGASALSIAANGTATFSADVNTATDVNAGDRVKGLQLESTASTGTPPLIVASDTEVANLNAEMVGGYTMTDLDTRYVNEAGDIVDGDITWNGDHTFGDGSSSTTVINGGNAALHIKNQPSAGKYSIGASNLADPSMIFKDNSGDTTLELFPNTATSQVVAYGATRVIDPDGISLQYSDTKGVFYIKVSNEADPAMEFKDHSEDNILTLYDDDNTQTLFGASRQVQAKVFGGLYVSDGIWVNATSHFGNGISVDSDNSSSSLFGSAVTFNGQTYHNGAINMQSSADIVMGSSSYIYFSEGNDSGSYTRSNWDGYIEVFFGGVKKRLYYEDA